MADCTTPYFDVSGSRQIKIGPDGWLAAAQSGVQESCLDLIAMEVIRGGNPGLLVPTLIAATEMQRSGGGPKIADAQSRAGLKSNIP